jgi:23S rRNA (uridine2552-2'-O)-methyltransferase
MKRHRPNRGAGRADAGKSGKGHGDPRWDHYADRAKKEGYAARSVYKLEEIDRRFHLLRPGAHVLDLGCHPGSWLQYAAEHVGKQGLVVGIDRTPTRAPAANARTIQADLTEPFDAATLGGPFDVVLSDMAPDTTGIRHVDQDRSAVLGEIALDFAVRLGKKGSAVVIKIFQGPDFNNFMNRVRQAYGSVRCVRPEATRKASFEVYVVGTDKRE